jgi:hypothetical protein
MLFAYSSLASNHVLRVDRRLIWHVLDGTERQIIKDVDGNMPRPKIKACSICDPFVLIHREDDSIGLFIETDRGRIRRKDMSPMGDKVCIKPSFSIFWFNITTDIAIYCWELLFRCNWHIQTCWRRRRRYSPTRRCNNTTRRHGFRFSYTLADFSQAPGHCRGKLSCMTLHLS